METQYTTNLGVRTEIVPTKVRYVLYARKSTESDEKQALSIESQVKEMLAIADRDGLTVVDIDVNLIRQKNLGNDQCLERY